MSGEREVSRGQLEDELIDLGWSAPYDLSTAVLASEWLAAHVTAAVTAEGERIAQAIEAEASTSSYRDRDDVTDAYISAARIARTAKEADQ